MEAARDVWSNPSLRLAAGLIVLFGGFMASLGVHQSLIAVEVFGLSDGAYALILGVALVASVAASVTVGIVTDRAAVRRRVALLTVVVTTLGAALVWLWPTPATFACAHALLLPVSGSIFGQVFAMARLAAEPLGAARRQGAMAALRARFAVPFVVVLPLWGFAFDRGVPLLSIYPAIALVTALIVLLVLLAWPGDAATPWRAVPSGLGLRASLAEIASASVLLRVALMGAVQVPPSINGILLGLTFAEAGRSVGDVGLYFGAFVAIEVTATLAVDRRSGNSPVCTRSRSARSSTHAR